MSVRRWSLADLSMSGVLVVWSGLANSGLIFDRRVGAISDMTRNAFKPASWAFAIRGPIYVALLVMAAFGVRRAFASVRWSEPRSCLALRAACRATSWPSGWVCPDRPFSDGSTGMKPRVFRARKTGRGAGALGP